jgi:uncharacterized membrane protein
VFYDLFFLMPVALGLFVLAGAAVAFVALQRTKDLAAQLRALNFRLDRLAAGEAPAAAPEPEPELAPAPEEPPAAAPEPEPTAEPAPVPEPEPTPEPQPGSTPGGLWVPPPRPAGPSLDWEEVFTARWLVWLGAVTLALGGLFLVKYSIDQGLVGPGARITFGILLGLALIVGGDWLRRRPLERAWAAISPSYVPPALAAAGSVTLFGSIFAAYALYDMLPPLVAFVLLALVAAVAVLLSFLHGPFMALLGIAGGFLIPALVSTGRPMAEGLFPYLLLLVAGALAVVRYMAWWWLAWVTLAGAVGWTLLWYLFGWGSGDVYIVGPYLLLTGALFVLLRYAAGPPLQRLPAPFALDQMPTPERIAWIALALIAFLLFIMVRMDNASVASLVTMALAVAMAGWLARREPLYDAMPIVALAMVALTLALWHLPRLISERAPMYVIDGVEIGKVSGPMVPPELFPFLLTSALFGALFAGGGFVALWGARRPGLWASVSAAAPLVFFATAYWRITTFETDLAWTSAGLLLAAFLVTAAGQASKYREAPGMTAALGAYAVGVVAALALAATTALENAWLTVALAAQLPAIAWIEARLKLPALRTTALVLASIVLVRLVLNPEVLGYRLGPTPALNWLLYGYGLPALAFFWAARWFRRRADDLVVSVLEAGALAFFVLLLTLEIRTLTGDGTLDAWRYPLAEQSLNSIVWLAVAYVLYRRQDILGAKVALWGWRILAGLATLQVLFLQVLVSNPLFTDDPVGSWPILNLMALSYGAPVAFALLFLRRARETGDTWVLRISGAVALIASFTWATLEVRHAFQGSQIGHGYTDDGEWYGYSLVWLIYAGVLLAVGIWRGFQALRYASLGIVMLTVAKVFLFDMSTLTGIYRALSFIGLGLVLVAVGYFYRRYVFPPRAPAATAPGA